MTLPGVSGIIPLLTKEGIKGRLGSRSDDPLWSPFVRGTDSNAIPKLMPTGAHGRAPLSAFNTTDHGDYLTARLNPSRAGPGTPLSLVFWLHAGTTFQPNSFPSLW